MTDRIIRGRLPIVQQRLYISGPIQRASPESFPTDLHPLPRVEPQPLQRLMTNVFFCLVSVWPTASGSMVTIPSLWLALEVSFLPLFESSDRCLWGLKSPCIVEVVVRMTDTELSLPKRPFDNSYDPVLRYVLVVVVSVMGRYHDPSFLKLLKI